MRLAMTTTPLLDVVAVQIEAPYQLLLTFENGETRRFDMAPLLMRKPYLSLADPARFAQTQVVAGTVAWPGEIDIAPETLYQRSRPM